MGYDTSLCASLAGFTLHAATRAGALDPVGREALLCYVLRPRSLSTHTARGRNFSPRTFAVDVLTCPSCQGRMRLLAVVKEPANIAGYLAHVGEMTEVPRRSPDRGPPHWKSRVLRLQAIGSEDASSGRQGYGEDEAA